MEPTTSRWRRAAHFAVLELRQPAAFLLPLRVFIAVGWLRASTEKLIDPSWYEGSALREFITDQLSWSQEAFPFYGWLMQHVLLPNATAVGLGVMTLQLVIGVAILVGMVTNGALIAGLALNVSFLMAGVPNPSAFYVVIQLVLLFGGAGAVLGVDARLSQRVTNPLLVAPSKLMAGDLRKRRRVFRLIAVVCAALAVAMLPFVSTLDPAHVVDDPALILLTMFLVGAAMAGVSAVAATGVDTQREREKVASGA